MTKEELLSYKNIRRELEDIKGHFAITIFDTRVFAMELFQYVKNAVTGEYYVKNGVWVCQKDVIDVGGHSKE